MLTLWKAWGVARTASLSGFKHCDNSKILFSQQSMREMMRRHPRVNIWRIRDCCVDLGLTALYQVHPSFIATANWRCFYKPVSIRCEVDSFTGKAKKHIPWWSLRKVHADAGLSGEKQDVIISAIRFFIYQSSKCVIISITFLYYFSILLIILESLITLVDVFLNHAIYWWRNTALTLFQLATVWMVY